MAWAVELNNTGSDQYFTLDTTLSCTNFDLEYDVNILNASDGDWFIMAGGTSGLNLLRLDIGTTSSSLLCRFNKSSVRTLTISEDLRNFSGKIKLTFRPGGIVSVYLDDVLEDSQTNASDSVFSMTYLQRYETLIAFCPCQIKTIEYVDYAGANSFFLSADASDHNSGTDPTTNPLILTDTVGTNNATGINVTDANWIDLGGTVEHVIDGDVTVTLTLDSDVNYQKTYSLDGDVALTLTPEALIQHITGSELIGDVTLTLSPSSDIEYSKNYNVDSDASLTITPESTIIYETHSGSVMDGGVTLTLTPNSDIEYAKYHELTADILLSISANGDIQQDPRHEIVGDVNITLTPSSTIQYGDGNEILIIGATLTLKSDVTTLSLSSDKTILGIK